MRDARTITELVQTLNGVLSTDLDPIYGKPRPGDVPESLADISLARQILGYEASVDFESGLHRTIASRNYEQYRVGHRWSAAATRVSSRGIPSSVPL